ncbi:probable apyrase 7 isoform X2 [Cornus florida]|uniref:probable apyrase 7 isoform X2 n=1 Tax=Cornus florida TaxID=4283 RepID=UPI00289BE91F|nr:probable apyrase 7 isoform X2 [Cornus florida]
MEPRSPSKFKLPMMGFQNRALRIGIIVLVMVLLLSVCVYVVLRPGNTQFVLKRSYFTVVVDCGSTGTRVNVIEWMIEGGISSHELPILVHSYPDNSTSSKLQKDGCQYHCLQTEPGLDKFVGNSSGVRASLEPLIIWAEQRVPSERHGETSIFVLATAGLRRLPREDAKRVLEDAEAVVKEHAFMYRKNWIRVLSGKEEAYYGWVALNYKMGTFKNSSRLQPTLGLLDLGGSSLQVVAETDELKEDEHFLRSKIGSFEHQILAYSLPAFGLNEAFDRTVVMLSHSPALREVAGGTFEISHPCLGFGLVQNYTCHGCFGPSSYASENSSRQVPKNESNSVFLVGDPNWEQCKLIARAAAINSSNSDWSQLADGPNCKAGIEIVNLMAVTHPIARFHALSGFFAVYNLLNVSPRANLTKIWEKGQQLCTRSWVDSSSIPGNKNYTGQYCFKVSYLASLIEDALCLSDKEIIFGPGDVSWTLGAALVEGEFLWLSSAAAQTNILTLKNTIPSPIFLFILLLGLLLIVYHCQVRLPMPGKKVAADGVSLPCYIFPKVSP